MAPERLRNLRRDPDTRSEVFSFGLILHEMLRGEHAFGPAEHTALPLAIQTKAPQALPRKAPAALARIVHHCLDKNPKRRFASMAEVFYALKKYAGTKHDLEGILMRNPARPGSQTAQASARRHASAIRRARAKLERISYRNIARSQEALADLARILEDDPAPALRKIIVLGLKDVILNVEYGESVPRAPLRQMRRGVLDVMKKAVQGALADHFKARELEHLDLYGMDFSGADLAGVSFQGCFLAEASFKRCRLAQASFAGAYIRNVDFAEADLSAVDLTGADWFNALSLSESQLRSARRETLLDCPADVRAIHRDLKNRYGFPFESWTAPVQEAITSAWRQYLRPGGLRDALIELQKHA